MISTQACSLQELAPAEEFEAEERESPAKGQDSAIECQYRETDSGPGPDDLESG